MRNILPVALVFVVFLSFSSENAGPGFYIKFYAFALSLTALTLSSDFRQTLHYFSRNLSGITLFLLFLFFMMLWNFVVSGFVLTQSIAVFSVALVGGGLFIYGENQPRRLATCVRVVIWVNILALLAQYGYFAVTGEVPYFHGDLFPFSRNRYMLVILGGFERFTGLQMEPGSYSTMVALLLIYYRRLHDRIDLTFIAGTLSIFFTFATIGLLFGTLIVLTVVFQLRWYYARNFLSAIIGAAVVLGVLIFGGVLDNIMLRFADGYQGDSSLNFKVLNFASYLDFSFIEMVGGLGILNTASDCIGCAHVKSNGVFFFMVYSLGLLGFVMMIALLHRASTRGLMFLLFTLVLLLCRYPPNTSVFWVIYLSLLTWPPKKKVGPVEMKAGNVAMRAS